MCPVSCGILAPQALGQMSLRTPFVFLSLHQQHAVLLPLPLVIGSQSLTSSHCEPGQN